MTFSMPQARPHSRSRSAPREENSSLDDSNVASDARDQLCGRLDESWQKAVQKFKDETGKDLGDFRSGKDGVLDTLQKKYDDGNHNTKKKDDLWDVVDKALYCVGYIGNMAAQIGSTAFQPASICYGALEALISIPQTYKKLRDDLRELFEQIMSFLTNFRTLERVDSQLGLDSALVEKTNDILLAMVDICRLSIDVPKHKFRTLAGNMFLKNDKVVAALDNFRRLIDEQNKLTSTTTLEAALHTRANTESIDRKVTNIGQSVNGMDGKLDDIQAFQSDDKNTRALQEDIADIDRTLGLTEAEVRRPLQALEQCWNNMLDQTMDVFAKDDQYSNWSRPNAQRRLLFLQGKKGSGRTYLLAALYRDINRAWTRLTKDDHKLYIAYYNFQRKDGMTGTEDWIPLRVALATMASQIARQSNKYTKMLHKNLGAIKDAHGLEDFWRELRLDDFEAPDNSTLYLFFDGLDRLKISLQLLNRTLGSPVSVTDSSLKTRRKLRLRVIFAGDKQTSDSLGRPIPPTIHVRELNGPLLRSFVENKMGSMLRDGLVLKRSAELTEAVLRHTTGSFDGVLQRLDMIKDAVSEDHDFQKLLLEIESSKDSDNLLVGAEVLDNALERLSSEHQQQLKEVLYWAVFGLSWLTVEQMEVALFLLRQRESLEPLESKLATRFAPAVSVEDEKVMADSDVEQYMRNVDSASTNNPTSPSKITLDMKIENVDESVIKRFVWDLNNAMSTDTFDFAAGLRQSKEANKERLRFSFAEGHYTLAMRCLQILNDDKARTETKPLLNYACINLPNHIYYLKEQKCYHLLSAAQRRTLGQGVVDFLADQECMDSVWELNPIWSWPWMYDIDNVIAMGHFLTDTLILQELDPRDRRTAEKLTRQTPEKPVPFLEPLAIVAASRWLDRTKAIENQERTSWHCVNAYLRLLARDFDSIRFRPETESSLSGTAQADGLFQKIAAVASVPDLQPPTENTQSVTNADSDDGRIANGNTNATASRTGTNGVTTSDETSTSAGAADPNLDKSSSVNGNTTANDGEAEESSTRMNSSDDRESPNKDKEQDDGEADPDSTSEQKGAIAPDAINGDRVKEALDWALKQLRLEEDYFVFLRLGRTLMDKDTPAAITYLDRACQNAPADDLVERLKAACALAEAHAHDSTTAAYDALLPMIEELRSLRGGRTFSEEEQKWLFEMLTGAADYLMEKEDDAAAVTILEDALPYSSNNGVCRHYLIRLLCKTGQPARAQELFDDWKKLSADDKRQGPPAHFALGARINKHVELSTFFYHAWPSPLHASIVQGLTDAIETDGDDPAHSDKSALHFARGLALAVTREDEELQMAVKDWEACIDNHVRSKIDNSSMLTDSWIYAAQYHFDLYKRQFLDDQQMSISQRTAMCRRLQDIVENLQVQEIASTCVTKTPLTYVAAFAKLAGLDSEAKEILKPDMRQAIRILRDDDPENDYLGLLHIYSVLLCYGDIPGLFSLWSLLDRDWLIERAQKRGVTQVVNGTSDTNGDDSMQQQESTPQTATDSSDGGQTAKVFDASLGSWTCDVCHKEIDRCAQEKMWSCMFCPNIDFCADCYAKLKNKELGRVFCSPDHVHVLILHLDYDLEEVQGHNVKIGGKITESGDNKVGKREGGTIVEFNKWIDMLEQEWEISQSG